MPVVKYGGKVYQIPFDPDKIATLLYQGYEVQPDEGTPEEVFKEHNNLIRPRLEKLWGNQAFTTTPGTMHKVPPPQVYRDGAKPMLTKPDSVDYLKVTPNPANIFPTPTIDPDFFIQRQLTPNPFLEQREAKNNYPVYGLMSSPFDTWRKA